MEVSDQLHAPAALPPWERAPGTHWIGGCGGSRTGLDAVVKRKIPSPCRDSNIYTNSIMDISYCGGDYTRRRTKWGIYYM